MSDLLSGAVEDQFQDCGSDEREILLQQLAQFATTAVDGDDSSICLDGKWA